MMAADDTMIWTEDDLRAAVRSLEGLASGSAPDLSVVCRAGARRLSARRRSAAALVAAAAVVTAAAARRLAQLVPGSGQPASASVMRRAILTSLDHSAGDILYVRSSRALVWSSSAPPAGMGAPATLERAWYAPWQP